MNDLSTIELKEFFLKSRNQEEIDYNPGNVLIRLSLMFKYTYATVNLIRLNIYGDYAEERARMCLCWFRYVNGMQTRRRQRSLS